MEPSHHGIAAEPEYCQGYSMSGNTDEATKGTIRGSNESAWVLLQFLHTFLHTLLLFPYNSIIVQGFDSPRLHQSCLKASAEEFAYVIYTHIRPHSYNAYQTPSEVRCAGWIKN